ncbi:peptidyl-prolyl cis-trans isomerase [Aphanothece sacrum FPU1]|uniref:peptidylprolyl isomerase n=2 Tax=Aphanothece sacrum TaxID=1122 RepID=A0A401IHC8_APHSA|nr:peptidylprolyl isomerase [Aphanothece sacrum]GBF80697.1 peptidyl-prolyl cis-trans isomerase [Aphanothece sacrum FPU1]GBF83191.1 peptidyl-prolyl cis-trans isomerase [Aphanothece sacrum FPU3]
MKLIKEFWSPILKGLGRLWKTSIVTLLMVALSLSLCGRPANAFPVQPMLISVLAQGNAITDPYAILRYALPIDNEPIRKIQSAIEDISNYLRGKRWPPIVKDVKTASFLLTLRSDKILEDVPETNKPQAQTILEKLKTEVVQLQEAADKKDKEQVQQIRESLLSKITDLEELMVVGFPFEVPAEYANLPQLKGRAIVEVETTKGTLTLVVDGYSAPVNAGNFVDLVKRGFYDNLPFSRSGDDFVVQTGDPIGPEEGFIDPETKEYRAIPLEILVKGEDAPIYGATLEDMGIYLPDLALPFNAYGAVALARPSLDPNGGSSQFFFFKFDNELTPPGFNLMDGRYAVFGYVIDGKEVLGEINEKDKIISAKVIDGLDNLVEPSAS